MTALTLQTAPTARLEEKVRAFAGEMGLYAKNLDTGETIAVNADTRFPTASLIKVAVMAEVYRQIAAGKLAEDRIASTRPPLRPRRIIS